MFQDGYKQEHFFQDTEEIGALPLGKIFILIYCIQECTRCGV